jgi:glycosyltransferase involved in cell wall biosynthesis
MLEKVCHIGPGFAVQGGISSVLVCYKKLFNLPEGNFIESYNGSFVRSLPVLLKVCLKLLFFPSKKFAFYQIHTSSYGSFYRKYLISRCLRFRGKKYTAHIHGSQFDKFCDEASPLLKWMLKDYFRHAERVLILSSEMKGIVQSVDPSIEKFTTIPNPGADIADAPVDLDAHELPVQIIFSGRFGKRKGVYDLIDAFSKANFSVPVKLSLFGDGEVEQVRAAVKESPKCRDISVSSWVVHSEYVKMLPKYDLLVLPSYAERFSMSLVEALGFGLPAISTFVGGTAEVVKDGECGILCEPGDIQALTRALEKLVNDKALRVSMGRAGWERAHSCFSGSVVLQKLEQVYQELAASEAG